MSELYEKFLDISKEEPENLYHARSKSGEVLSSGMLKKFIRNPLEYYYTVNGQIPDKESEALSFGSACHKFVLEGEGAFLAAYDITDGPINMKTEKPYGKDTNKYREWAAERERPFVSMDDFNNIKVIAASVHKHPIASEFFIDGVPERVIRVEIEGVLCQIRLDFFNSGGLAIDYKTDKDLGDFEYSYKKYQYNIQFAFYQMVLEKALDERPPFYCIATEKSFTARTGVWLCDYEPGFFDYILGQIREFKRQKEEGFKTNFEDIKVLT